MAKAKSFYVCSECGYKTIKWMGKCENCGEWGTFDEEIEISPAAAKNIKSSTKSLVNIQEKVVSFANIQLEKNFRYKTKISEFDRLLGGG
ncbi:MAG: DNA repair protein RadA, partial [Cetobacterium sp.]